MTAAPDDTLASLRQEIDRLDHDMHQLLMQRGTIIDRLIAVKAKQGGGSAFRPEREADMLRVLVERHQGRLPLDTVESIWRVIISTFTYLQSPYCVHGDASGGDAVMRDIVRFHFGFTVPYRPHHSPLAVINAVAGSLRADGGGDLGLLHLSTGVARTPWWLALAPESAPKIIARLPFVSRANHPAGAPVFVISNPLVDSAARDIALYGLMLPRWSEDTLKTIHAFEGEVIETAAELDDIHILFSVPATDARADIEAALLVEPGASLSALGSHARCLKIA